MDKWLKNKALSVYIEMTNNTKNGGKALEEFAKYTGRKSGEDVLYFIFKNVAEHVEFCIKNPDVADEINQIPYHL